MFYLKHTSYWGLFMTKKTRKTTSNSVQFIIHHLKKQHLLKNLLERHEE